MEKKLILISNDDSVNAPGLHVLVDCVKDLGEVWVVAPAEPKSGQSSSLTFNAPLRVTEHPDYEGAHLFSVSGTPVDCVKLAMHTILPRRPDLVLAGINHGSNAGNSVIYSGTMGAVFEGCMDGIPSIGYSLLHHSMAADFSECLPFVKSLTAEVLDKGLPEGVCLNVNFPAKVKIEGMKVVRAARSHWTEEYKQYIDPHGKPFYWLTGSQVNEDKDNPETDLYWLSRNYATCVPCTALQNASPAEIASVAESLGYK
ncbi:MAG: 5'/3'-nucleotidase SurE [Muribaculaceae bacterium]|nr:5'/3'-nucleotidase SurE [Muribaculaceae bacterium]